MCRSREVTDVHRCHTRKKQTNTLFFEKYHARTTSYRQIMCLFRDFMWQVSRFNSKLWSYFVKGVFLVGFVPRRICDFVRFVENLCIWLDFYLNLVELECLDLCVSLHCSVPRWAAVNTNSSWRSIKYSSVSLYICLSIYLRSFSQTTEKFKKTTM